MKMKRVLAILLALSMVLLLAACGGNGDAKTTTTAGDTETTTTVADGGDVADDPVDDPEVTQTTATDKDGNVVTTTTKKGETTKRTKKSGGIKTVTQAPEGTQATVGQITVKEGTVRMDKGLDFGGKTFTHAKNGTGVDRTSDYGKWCTEFEKKYNAKLEVSGLSYNEYTAGITAAMAGGSPYDIVFMTDAWFPEQIIANTMLPLDNYFTTADLWNEKSKSEGGLSYSLSEDMSLNGKVYVVGGTYLTTPGTIWYNKKMFAAAGFDGKDDPLALYNAGKWTWDKYYEMLSEIQDPASGLYGMNSISPYYSRMMFPSFGTDIAKRTSAGFVANVDDPQLYKAFETMQKFNYGQRSVCDPKNQYEDGETQFLNGTTASLMGYTGYAWDLYEAMDKKTYSAFGTKAQQKANIGMVPMPVANSQGIHAIWGWMGFGAGNGTDEDGIKAAIAFAINDSRLNHKNVYHPEMPADILKAAQALADSDNLMAPMWGFDSSAGSLGGLQTAMCRKIANQGENITVVLKGYEKLIQTVIDTALKH